MDPSVSNDRNPIPPLCTALTSSDSTQTACRSLAPPRFTRSNSDLNHSKDDDVADDVANDVADDVSSLAIIDSRLDAMSSDDVASMHGGTALVLLLLASALHVAVSCSLHLVSSEEAFCVVQA